jgi:uncharacterized protein DUF5989/acetyltransferase AlgX (SGNH hydrolase-like protein)
MRQLNVLLSVLISLALAVFVMEFGLRIAGFGFPETLNQYDADTGWSKTPGKVVHSSTRDFDVTIEINQLGLRDDPMSSPAKTEDNVFRVLCLGDSFTLGSTVDRQDLFVDQLEGWWRSEERRAETINAGTEGWSTDQEARWFEKHGAAYQPDLVLLATYENDLYWCGQTDYFGKSKPRYGPDGLLEARELIATKPTSGLQKSAILRFLAAFIGPRGDSPYSFTPEGGDASILKEFGALLVQQPDFMADAEARAKGSLIALQRAVAAAGAELILVPIPSHSAVDEDFAQDFGSDTLELPREAWDPQRPVDVYIGFAQELGIKHIDVRDELRARVADGERLYHRIDWHLNPAGNRALATVLHDRLDGEDLGVFPTGHLARTKQPLPARVKDDGLPGWLPVYLILWIFLSVLYATSYRDEPVWRVPLQVGALLAVIFTIVLGGGAVLRLMPPSVSMAAGWIFVLAIIGFVLYKLGRRVGTITELIGAFTRRGHWYLMPLLVILLTIGSLLVVAASSPFVAPFIYTLF